MTFPSRSIISNLHHKRTSFVMMHTKKTVNMKSTSSSEKRCFVGDLETRIKNSKKPKTVQKSSSKHLISIPTDPTYPGSISSSSTPSKSNTQSPTNRYHTPTQKHKSNNGTPSIVKSEIQENSVQVVPAIQSMTFYSSTKAEAARKLLEKDSIIENRRKRKAERDLEVEEAWPFEKSDNGIIYEPKNVIPYEELQELEQLCVDDDIITDIGSEYNHIPSFLSLLQDGEIPSQSGTCINSENMFHEEQVLQQLDEALQYVSNDLVIQ